MFDTIYFMKIESHFTDAKLYSIEMMMFAGGKQVDLHGEQTFESKSGLF